MAVFANESYLVKLGFVLHLTCRMLPENPGNMGRPRWPPIFLLGLVELITNQKENVIRPAADVGAGMVAEVDQGFVAEHISVLVHVAIRLVAERY